MITVKNVLTEYQQLDQSTLPEALQYAEFSFVAENLDLYSEDEDIRSYIDAFVRKLNEYAAEQQPKAKPQQQLVVKKARIVPTKGGVVAIPQPEEEDDDEKKEVVVKKKSSAAGKAAKPKPATKVKQHKPKFREGQQLWWFDNDGTLKTETIRRVGYATSGEPVYQTVGVADWKYSESELLTALKKRSVFLERPPEPVEKASVEVAIIRRYAALHGKQNPREAVRRLLATLQKAIVERQIRKSSPYAKEITTIQQNLVTMVNVKGSLGTLELPNVEHYQAIGSSQKVMLCARLVKRFIAIQGKSEVKEKAKKLQQQVADFLCEREKSHVPYWNELQEIVSSLRAYTTGKTATPQVSMATLNGLMGIAGLSEEECSCAKKVQPGQPLSSVDLMKQHFSYLSLGEPWASLIGSMDEPFKIMFYGKDGNGKSSAAMSLASYFASSHGKRVLYVSDEERVSGKLQERIRRLGLAHPSFFVVDKIPTSLAGYEVVCLDSVSSMGVEPAELEAMAKKYPKMSWIYVFQTTKEGEFRGSQEYAHNVDARFVVTKGVVSQGGKNRYGGKGSVRIF